MRNLSALWSCGALVVLAGCSGSLPGHAPSPLLSPAQAGGPNPDSAPAIVEITSVPVSPLSVASDGTGNEWTAGTDPAMLIRINETSHVKTKFDLPNSSGIPDSVALGRHQKGLWFADQYENQVGWINLTTQAIHRYNVPTHNAGLWSIAAGPDNAMWFTEAFVGKIGRIELAHFTISEYAIPHNADPYAITLGSDGALWFTEFLANGIGRITTGGQVTQFTLPHADSGPYGITSGPDGAVWFTESNTHMAQVKPNVNQHGRIGRIDPTTHAISEWTLSTTDTFPNGIVSRNNDLWFTETAGYVGRIDSTTHAIDEYTVPAGGGPRAIALGKDNQLWFVQADGKRVGKVCPDKSDHQCTNGN